MVNLFSLAGKVALVTGASRGIGRGVAAGMAEAGATVICAARTRSQLDEAVTAIEASGGKARAVELDMADLEGMDAALEQCGPIDILFNNAGMNIRQPIVEVSEENYDQIMAVNLKGLYF
ncbi:MAG: SDR family NAD(P)-dependent oxidoreductase, partial [Opitutae bacterium]|nr:SDR family NAD(P)-dependent oxidoreductase [Opitutae bacterium]